MVQVKTGREPIRLDYRGGTVVVTPADEDIFLISAEKATQACREVVRSEEHLGRFRTDFLLPLHAWCVGRAGRVDACYMPTPSGHIQVFVVTRSARFDFALADEIAALERDLAARGWKVGVSQLPSADPSSLATFFNADGALEVYAQRESA